MTILADNIAELARRAKRQQDLADAIGVNQSTVNRWAKGAKPEPEALVALARYAGVSVERLVEIAIADWSAEDRETFKHDRRLRGWSAAVLVKHIAAIGERERVDVSVSVKEVETFEEGRGEDEPAWLHLARMALQEGGVAENRDTAARDDLVYLPRFDISYAMGAGSDIDPNASLEMVPFNLGFLRMFTSAAPSQLFLASGHGNSMEPTLLKDDIVLIDTADRDFRLGDIIWALNYAGQGYIKRLRRVRRDGADKVLILSDNPTVPAEEADPADVQIVGKVVWVARRPQ